MADKFHKQTDIELRRLERQIKTEYTKAYKEMKKEMSDIALKLQADPNMSLHQKMLLANKYNRLDKLCEQMATVLKDTNASATKFVEKSMQNVYKINYNGEAERLGFAVLDNTAVKNVLTEEVNPFTKLSIAEEKDKQSIIRKLKSEMTTSILKGDSINQMARRLKNVAEGYLGNTIRIARTETTRIENSARNSVGEHGKELGFDMWKKWVATPDARTRDAHKSADGQEVPQDEPFIVDGEKMMYPGDISLGASAKNVINCRCTMVSVIKRKDYNPDIKVQENVQVNYKKLDEASGELSKTFFGTDEVNWRTADLEELPKDSMYMKWKGQVSSEELTAIRKYTDNEYIEINQQLRRGLDWGMEENIERISSAIDKFNLTEPIEVYRGISESAVENFFGTTDLSKIKGSIISDDGFVSTSTLMHKAESFSTSNIVCKIHIPLGKGNGAFIAKESVYNRENEFLLQKGSSFEVVSVDEDANGTKIVTLKLLK